MEQEALEELRSEAFEELEYAEFRIDTKDVAGTMTFVRMYIDALTAKRDETKPLEVCDDCRSPGWHTCEPSFCPNSVCPSCKKTANLYHVRPGYLLAWRKVCEQLTAERDEARLEAVTARREGFEATFAWDHETDTPKYPTWELYEAHLARQRADHEREVRLAEKMVGDE